MLSLKPVGWTVNLISLLWVWVIFLAVLFLSKTVIMCVLISSFMRFPKHRHYLKLFGAVLMVGAFAYSFGPSWDNRAVA